MIDLCQLPASGSWEDTCFGTALFR